MTRPDWEALEADDDTLPCDECGADITQPCKADCPTLGEASTPATLSPVPNQPKTPQRTVRVPDDVLALLADPEADR